MPCVLANVPMACPAAVRRPTALLSGLVFLGLLAGSARTLLAGAPVGPLPFHGNPTRTDSVPTPSWSNPSDWAEIRAELLENARDLQLEGLIQPDQAAESYLEAVLDSVLAGSPGWRPRVRIGLGCAGQANAFTHPSGQIWVEPGLLCRMENEAQLAAVLAHEVGHVVGQHGEARLRLVWEEGIWRRPADPHAQTMFLAQSRSQEFAADSLGWLILAHSRYQPQAMDRALELLGHAFQPVGKRHWSAEVVAGLPPLGIPDSAWSPDAFLPDTAQLPDSLLTHPGVQDRRKHLPQVLDSLKPVFLVSKLRFDSLRRRAFLNLPKAYLESGLAQGALFESWSRLETAPKDSAMRHLFWQALVEVARQKCYLRQGINGVPRQFQRGAYGSLVHFLLRTDGLDLASLAFHERKRGLFRMSPGDSLRERILWASLEQAYPLQMEALGHPERPLPRAIRGQASHLGALAKQFPLSLRQGSDSLPVDEAQGWTPQAALLLPILWSPHVQSQALGGRDAGRTRIDSFLASHLVDQYRGRIEPRLWTADSTKALDAARILVDYMERRLAPDGKAWARPLLPSAQRAAARWGARQAIWLQMVSGIFPAGRPSLIGEMSGSPSLCLVVVDLQTGNVVARARTRTGEEPEPQQLEKALRSLWDRLAHPDRLTGSEDDPP